MNDFEQLALPLPYDGVQVVVSKDGHGRHSVRVLVHEPGAGWSRRNLYDRLTGDEALDVAFIELGRMLGA